MTKEQYFQFAESFFNNCIETSKKKNADYTGGSTDPFSNFSSVEILGIPTEVGFLTRMFDKMKRISSFVKNGELQVKDESVVDTLADLANYSCLFAGYLQSKKNDTDTNFKSSHTEVQSKVLFGDRSVCGRKSETDQFASYFKEINRSRPSDSGSDIQNNVNRSIQNY